MISISKHKCYSKISVWNENNNRQRNQTIASILRRQNVKQLIKWKPAEVSVVNFTVKQSIQSQSTHILCEMAFQSEKKNVSCITTGMAHSEELTTESSIEHVSTAFTSVEERENEREGIKIKPKW